MLFLHHRITSVVWQKLACTVGLCMLIVLTQTGCQSRNQSAETAVVDNLSTNPERTLLPISVEETLDGATPGDPRYKPLRPGGNAPIQVPTGSLFHADQYEGLFHRKKRFLVGDMVQVILEERTSASKNLDLQRDKSSELNVDPLELNAGPLSVNRGDISINHDQSSAFSSSSTSRQSNTLDGVINVFVKDILVNGNLVIAGEKWIKLNEGDEYIRMRGEIRRDDINENNQISSLLVGNAQIEYSGTGSLADNQTPSVFDKILSLFN